MRHEVNNLESSVVVQELEFAINRALYGVPVVVPYCSCCLCLYFGSSIMLVTYFVNFW